MWVRKKFPFYRQIDEMDCGSTCLKIICKYYGKTYSLEYLRRLTFTDREGSNLLNISHAADKIGFKTFCAKAKYEDLACKENLAPFICYWDNKHFIVVYKIDFGSVWISDPACGKVKYSKKEFLKFWNKNENWGIVLFLKPDSDFNTRKETFSQTTSNKGFSIVFDLLKNYKKTVFHILLGLLTTSLLQLTIPFLTQNIVDKGIVQKNLNFILLILCAQLVMFFGRTFVELIRSRLLLYLSSQLSIKLMIQFIIKLMKLPIAYYDRKRTGDIIQRINDHSRVETFITSGILGFTYAIVTLIVFLTVLLVYSKTIFIIFLIGSVLYFGWIQIFATKRAILDYKKFEILSATNDKNLEILSGMQEIKLNNAETQKSSEWEKIQISQSEINLKSLNIKQIQIDGASVINELKNFIITFIAAMLVIENVITIGMMLSISFISGQLNGPIGIITQFLQDLQDARLSMARINEIHDIAEENSSGTEQKLIFDNEIFKDDLQVKNLSFKYSNSPNYPLVLKNINLIIPKNCVTAIVGSSGSGKTTLMKLLLKIYEPEKGEIIIGKNGIKNLIHSEWRSKIGVVLQEGFIFNDTIANNIALGNERVDHSKLTEACKISNILEFVEQLPLKFNTLIGITGMGLSTGQKQRLLIARAVYKNPEIIFFDEATSALDANNEKEIMTNLSHFFKGKTVFIIAHRLSTVVNADQIIVLEHGEIVEQGNHDILVNKRGNYYNLIKNQLELGQ